MAGGNNPKNWSTISDPTTTAVSNDKNEQNVNPKDWPTLSDSTNTTSLSVKKEQTKLRSDAPENATGMENIDASTNGHINGARRKQPGKTKWSRVPIEMLPYRDNKNERHHNNYEPSRYASNHRNNGYEATNGSANGHENFRGRPYRGGRHGRGNPHRFRRDNAAPASEPRRYQKLPPEVESAPSVEEATGTEDSVFPPDVQVLVMRQIEYYFSEKNLLKDTFLRMNMDEQGYVQLSLIANFPRIKSLTGDVQLILAAVKKSCYLEASNDAKVRPVVDPLRWPIKKRIDEPPIAVNTADPYLDLMTAQMYNMCLDPSAYPHMAVPPAHELPWPYLPNGHDKNGVYCPINVIYPQADSNGLVASGGVDLTNEHSCLPGQLDGTSPDLYNGVASQYEIGYTDTNGTMFDPAEEVPLHFETNDVENSADSSNASNGDESTSDLVSSCNSESNDVSSEYTNEIPHKNSTVVCSANGIHDSSTDNGDISDEQEATSSDLRHSVESSNVNGFGQMPNDVIIYNKGGKYYVPPSNEILSGKSAVPCEDSSLNKSPEPSR